MRLATRAAGAVVLVGVLTGCGQTVDEGDLVDQVSSVVEQASGSAPDAVDCPDDLDAEEGATTTCTLESQGDEYDVDIEVTGVDGDQVNFSIQVASEPN